MISGPLVRSFDEAAVVIAGGSSGIGLASALGFVRAGVTRLALLSRDPERGATARQTILDACPGPADVVHVPVDAHDPAQATAAIERAHRELGAIDVLVNSVAATNHLPDLLHRTPIEDIPGILQAQALPPMLLTRAACRNRTAAASSTSHPMPRNSPPRARPCSAAPWRPS
jgi:NAD(P)-dependent dehydrogenase (short-subunit alcohol dehydrogenase family)